jgi:ABC-type hemin transport system ATPase subunit
VSFDLTEGGVRVLGLNGAGKPTTLRTTAGEATIATCRKGGPHSGYRHLADKTAMAGGRHEG